MLYLRTGSNGTFKTALTLWDVRQMQLKEGRQVLFVKDRFEAKPILTDDFGWKPIEFKEWLQHRNCIILMDEAHYDIPKIPETAKRPDEILKLAEHRKFGHDIFILDQHPLNIDPFVRRLIGAPGYHQHFLRVFGGANAAAVLQWDAVNTTCEKPNAGKSAQVTNRLPEKEAYGWYESASLHTAKVRVPKQLYTLVGCVLALAVLVYFLVTRFMPGSTGGAVEAKKSTPAASEAAFQVGVVPNGNERRPMTKTEYVAAYQPRLPGLMHTAPAYDDLTKPKRVPVPAACIEVTKELRNGGMVGCRCYTQDATPYPVDLAMCRQLVAQGTFLAFQPEGERKPLEVAQKTPVGPETALPGMPSGLTVIDNARPAAAPPAIAAAGAPDLGAQPRVPKSSPWSFQVGG
jgi:zona occludens toxin